MNQTTYNETNMKVSNESNIIEHIYDMENRRGNNGDNDFYPPTHPVLFKMTFTARGFAYKCHMSSREKKFMCEQAFAEDGIPLDEYSAWQWLKIRPDMQVKYNAQRIFKKNSD